MAKVTTKLQVTIPKVLAARYHIAPGDEIDWQATGPGIQIVPARADRLDLEQRLALFDQASQRQAQRARATQPSTSTDRGWSRADLYEPDGAT